MPIRHLTTRVQLGSSLSFFRSPFCLPLGLPLGLLLCHVLGLHLVVTSDSSHPGIRCMLASLSSPNAVITLAINPGYSLDLNLVAHSIAHSLDLLLMGLKLGVFSLALSQVIKRAIALGSAGSSTWPK